MSMHHASVLEIDELMLAATPHGDDPRADDGTALGGRHAPAQRWVVDDKRFDAPADEMAAQ
jgi:hypothetical protein